MAIAKVGLRGFQIGIEATRGTLVDAKSERQFNSDFSASDEPEFETFENQVTGVNAARRTISRVRENRTRITEVSNLDFRQLHAIMGASILGGVTPEAITGATMTDRRIYEVPMRQDPMVDTYSLRYGISDGTNDLVQAAPYGFVPDWTVSAGVGSQPTISAMWEARAAKPSTYTPNLAWPADAPYADNFRIAVYDDADWSSAIGRTGRPTSDGDHIIGGIEIGFTGGPMAIGTAQNREDGDFTSIENMAMQKITVSGTALIGTAANEFFREQRAHKAARTGRYMSFLLQGDDIEQDDASNQLTNELWVIGYFQHTQASLATIDGSEENGQATSPFELESTSDGENHFRVIVVSTR